MSTPSRRLKLRCAASISRAGFPRVRVVGYHTDRSIRTAEFGLATAADFSLRPLTTTFALSATNSRAAASPSPRAPPATMYTRSFSPRSIAVPVYCAFGCWARSEHCLLWLGGNHDDSGGTGGQGHFEFPLQILSSSHRLRGNQTHPAARHRGRSPAAVITATADRASCCLVGARHHSPADAVILANHIAALDHSSRPPIWAPHLSSGWPIQILSSVADITQRPSRERREW
jgi:hypothetical protein